MIIASDKASRSPCCFWDCLTHHTYHHQMRMLFQLQGSGLVQCATPSCGNNIGILSLSGCQLTQRPPNQGPGGSCCLIAAHAGTCFWLFGSKSKSPRACLMLAGPRQQCQMTFSSCPGAGACISLAVTPSGQFQYFQVSAACSGHCRGPAP